MNNNLVSILTPVYNGEDYIGRLFDSILKQDYPAIEVIVINDGSTDNTLGVITNYEQKFIQKGYLLKVYSQSNQGLSYAINNGLKYINGEYLVWPDSDDYFSRADTISQYVNSLEKNSCKIGRCQVEFVDEATLKSCDRTHWHSKKIDNLFEDCLYVKNGFGFCPGSWIISVDALDECIKNREIYTDRTAGQSYQLLLPVLYKYNCVSIDKFLHTMVCRFGSLSRESVPNYDKIAARNISYKNALLYSLNSISDLPIEKKQLYIKDIEAKYARFLFVLSCKFRKIREAQKYRDFLTSKLCMKLGWKEELIFVLAPLSPYVLIKYIQARFSK